jgi:opacity protein-like surface antigen
MTKGTKWFLMSLVLTIFWGSLKAQESKGSATKTISGKEGFSTWSISLSGGTSVFFGDVKQNPLLPVTTNRSELRYVADIGLERRFSAILAARLQAAYSHVLGTKRVQDIHFQSFVYEANLAFLFYPFNLIGGYDNNLFADFYLVAGGGMANYDAKLYQLSTGKELSSRGFGAGNGISGMQSDIFMLGGIGVDFPIHPNWTIRFETSQRVLTTDDFDMRTGEKNNSDSYNYTKLGIVYSFSKRPVGVRKLPDSSTPPSLRVSEDSLIARKDTIKMFNDTLSVVGATEEKDSWESLNKVVELTVEPEAKIDTLSVVKEVIGQPAVLTENLELAKTTVKEYRVQILANGKRAADIETLAKKCGLEVSEISQERYNGMFIYTVGSYATYAEAASRRNKVKTENSVPDAFVVYFESGERQARFPEIRQ